MLTWGRGLRVDMSSERRLAICDLAPVKFDSSKQKEKLFQKYREADVTASFISNA